jgi:hypothetical protein
MTPTGLCAPRCKGEERGGLAQARLVSLPPKAKDHRLRPCYPPSGSLARASHGRGK